MTTVSESEKVLPAPAPFVLPEVKPMQDAINGGALASRVAKIERQLTELPRLVREAIRQVRDEPVPPAGD